MSVSIEIKGDKELIRAFESIEDGISDWSKGPTYPRVRQIFYRKMKEQFGAEGKGQSGAWKPLTPAYAKVKQAKYGNLPINQRTGRTYKSLTSGGGDAIIEERPDSLTLGSKVPWVGFVQNKRPLIDFTSADEKEIAEPFALRLRQLADNARLRGLR